MNREQSIAHFEKIEAIRKAALDEGKSQEVAHEVAKAAWNEWAEGLLAEKKVLKESGRWKIGREKTEAWLEKANLDFSALCIVPKEKEVQNKAQGDKGKIVVEERGIKQIFCESSDINFSGYIFPSYAAFRFTVFSSDAVFRSSEFRGYAAFSYTTFCYDAYFSDTIFNENADFESSDIYGDADFSKTIYNGDALFNSAKLKGHTTFSNAEFRNSADFILTMFGAKADFISVKFSGNADFRYTVFISNADFVSTEFRGYVTFSLSKFSGITDFSSTAFNGSTHFGQSTFEKYTNFSDTTFRSQASFHAIDSQVSFNLSHARFHHVPDFLNAKFREEEPPNLDNVKVTGQSFLYLKEDTATKFRKLKKMAIQAHYSKGELEFHAQELQADSFAIVGGWPAIKKRFYNLLSDLQANITKLLNTSFWFFLLQSFFSKLYNLPQLVKNRFKTLFEVERFTFPKLWTTSLWFTLLYSVFSDFGRSVARPLIAWGILILLCTSIYFTSHKPVGDEVSRYWKEGVFQAYFTFYNQWNKSLECLCPNLQGKSNDIADKLLGSTTPQWEAFSLSLKNAFVFIDWDRSEAALQTYGCLYGLNETKTTLVPTVPPLVSIISIIQNVLSVIFIFLFGLALRNMLKLK